MAQPNREALITLSLQSADRDSLGAQLIYTPCNVPYGTFSSTKRLTTTIYTPEEIMAFIYRRTHKQHPPQHS